MLTVEQNEMITRVGPGTPMGELFRNYWIPFLPSSDLEPDGGPMRVRLLCEDLARFGPGRWGDDPGGVRVAEPLRVIRHGPLDRCPPVERISILGRPGVGHVGSRRD